VQTAPSVPVDPDLAGFMPKRGEFETEYDNDAEFLIKDMVFEEDDTQEEKGTINTSIRILAKNYTNTTQMLKYSYCSFITGGWIVELSADNLFWTTDCMT
jgi:hypothetical protein